LPTVDNIGVIYGIFLMCITNYPIWDRYRGVYYERYKAIV
jgi:hypothetical protein